MKINNLNLKGSPSRHYLRAHSIAMNLFSNTKTKLKNGTFIERDKLIINKIYSN